MKIVGEQTEWGIQKIIDKFLAIISCRKDPSSVTQTSCIVLPVCNSSSTLYGCFLVSNHKTNKGDIRLSKTITLIRVATDVSLVDLKALVRAQPESEMYTPAWGFFWFRKDTKQLVELKSEEDLQNCKSDYAKGGKPATGIRIACSTLDLEAGWF